MAKRASGGKTPATVERSRYSLRMREEGAQKFSLTEPHFEEDLNLLKGLFNRTRNQYYPNWVRGAEDFTLFDSDGVCKLGLISCKIDIREGGNRVISPDSLPEFKSIISDQSRHQLQREQAEFEKCLGAHVNAGCRLICASEFGFPLNHTTTSKGYTGGGPNSSKMFGERLRKLAKGKNVGIIAGTYGSSTDRQNLCVLHFPNEPPKTHPKLNPAVSLGERLKGRDNNGYRAYKTKDGFTFTILVCFDAYDLSFSSRIIKQNVERIGRDARGNDYSQIDIIFIPSYSESCGEMAGAACDLSLLAGAIVVFVNYDDCVNRNDVFVGGRSLRKDQASGEYKSCMVGDDRLRPVFEIRSEDIFTLRQDGSLRLSHRMRDVFNREVAQRRVTTPH